MLESNLNQLFASTVEAFPETRKRQYATNPIEILQLEWTPFVGMKTLFVRCNANNTEGGDYKACILFKNVYYRETLEENVVSVKDALKKAYFFNKLNENDVLVRCQCADAHWRFSWYNTLDGSHYGSKRTPYQGKYRINPKEMAGMCKHLLKLWREIWEAGLIKDSWSV